MIRTPERPSRLQQLRPQRVAVLRALHLGDLLCAVPSLRALRAALPDAEVTLIGLPWAREFVARFNRYVDGFLELPGYPGLPERPPEPERLPAFLSAVRRRRFDLALQMHGSGPITNPLTALLGARVTAGFYRPEEHCPDTDWFVPYPDEGPEPRRLLRLMEFLGASPAGTALEFPMTPGDREALASVPGARDLRPGRYVCLHPGSRSPARRWPAECFAAVADALARRGLRVVITGTIEERPVTRAVMTAMTQPLLDFTGRTGLGSLAALLSEARLLVCNDTGVSHLAAALGTPSVVAFTGSDPDRWAPLDGDRHRAVACTPADGPESPSLRRVLAEAEDLLAGEPAHAR